MEKNNKFVTSNKLQMGTVFVYLFLAQQASVGQGLLILDASQSVGLLWTSDQLVAETST